MGAEWVDGERGRGVRGWVGWWVDGLVDGWAGGRGRLGR